MSIPLQNVLFYGGAECLQRFGRLSWLTSPGEDNPEVHTRAGINARFVDRDGALRTAGANVPRIHWLDLDGDADHETPTLLLEPGRTNLVPSDEVDAWDRRASPTIETGIDDPAGEVSAFRITDNDTGGTDPEWVSKNVDFDEDGTKSVAFVVREATMASAGSQAFGLRDATALVWRNRLEVSSWVSGEPQVTAAVGAYLGKERLKNGYWTLYGQATGVVAANVNQVVVAPALTPTATGSLDFYRANAYEDAVPPASILGAAGVLGAESFYFRWPFGPMGMVVDLHWIEIGAAALALETGTAKGVFHIGRGLGADPPRFQLQARAAGGYELKHHNFLAEVASAIASPVPAYLQSVKARCVLMPDGSVYLGQKIGVGAEVISTPSAANALAAAWEGQASGDGRLYLGSLGDSGESGGSAGVWGANVWGASTWGAHTWGGFGAGGTATAGLLELRSIKVVRFTGTAPSRAELDAIFPSPS